MSNGSNSDFVFWVMIIFFSLIFILIVASFGNMIVTFAADGPGKEIASKINEETIEEETDIMIDNKTLVYVTADLLNLREGPGLQYPVITRVPYGTQLEKLDDSGDGWFKVTNGSFIGWVKNNYIVSDPLPEGYKNYSDEDLYWLAHVIMAEMESESWENKIYTGSVVLNRVAWPHWFKNTIHDVIFQRNPLQYQCIVDGRINLEPNEESWAAARFLLENGSQIPPNVLFQAEFRNGTGIWKKVGRNYYCYGE